MRQLLLLSGSPAMAHAPSPPATLILPLAVPQPTVLERLQAITAPPPWPDRWLRPCIVCEVDQRALRSRCSHTYRSLGVKGFRVPLDHQARELTGAFAITPAANAPDAHDRAPAP
jgi:hypothetical protein